MVYRIIEIFISSNLQGRPRIFKEFFVIGRLIKIFISSNLKRRQGIFKEFFTLGRKIRIFFFFKSAKLFGPFIIAYIVSKINQGSCLGCLGGDDAPDTYYV